MWWFLTQDSWLAAWQWIKDADLEAQRAAYIDAWFNLPHRGIS